MPIVVKDEKGNTIIKVKRVFPKCERDEARVFQGEEEEEPTQLRQNLDLRTEPESFNENITGT